MRKYLNVFKNNFLKQIHKRYTILEMLKTNVDRTTQEYNVITIS